MSTMVAFDHITKRFGKLRALNDISFEVKKGEVLGFLGPNGAGKTTAMRILTGYFPPTEGCIYFDGKKVDAEEIAFKRRIGYLPEMVPLYHDLKVFDFLKFVAKIRGVKRRQLSDHIHHIAKECGLGDVTQRYIAKLSKGYKQRVGLAQSLIGDPEVLILDEPTTGLDPKQIIEIRSLIQKLAGERTVILSSHILPEVSLLCGRVVIINKGQIVASDTPSQLTKQMGKKQELKLTIKGEQGAVEPLLKSLTFVESLAIQLSEDGHLECLVKVASERDVRNDMMKFCLEKSIELLELQVMKMSLEDIFVRLVTEEKVGE